MKMDTSGHATFADWGRIVREKDDLERVPGNLEVSVRAELVCCSLQKIALLVRAMNNGGDSCKNTNTKLY